MPKLRMHDWATLAVLSLAGVASSIGTYLYYKQQAHLRKILDDINGVEEKPRTWLQYFKSFLFSDEPQSTQPKMPREVTDISRLGQESEGKFALVSGLVLANDAKVQNGQVVEYM